MTDWGELSHNLIKISRFTMLMIRCWHSVGQDYVTPGHSPCSFFSSFYFPYCCISSTPANSPPATHLSFILFLMVASKLSARSLAVRELRLGVTRSPSVWATWGVTCTLRGKTRQVGGSPPHPFIPPRVRGMIINEKYQYSKILNRIL